MSHYVPIVHHAQHLRVSASSLAEKGTVNVVLVERLGLREDEFETGPNPPIRFGFSLVQIQAVVAIASFLMQSGAYSG